MANINLSKLDSLIKRLSYLREEMSNINSDVVIHYKFGSIIGNCKIVAVYRDLKSDKEEIGIEIQKLD